MFGGFPVASWPVSDVWTQWPPGVLGVGIEPAAHGFALAPAAPNPSRGPVTIAFTAPRSTRATLRVYDLSGRLVATLLDGSVSAGNGVASWGRRYDSGAIAAPGVYLCELRAGAVRLARRFVILH